MLYLMDHILYNISAHSGRVLPLTQHGRDFLVRGFRERRHPSLYLRQYLEAARTNRINLTTLRQTFRIPFKHYALLGLVVSQPRLESHVLHLPFYEVLAERISSASA